VMYMVKEDTELKMFEKKQLDWIGSPLSMIPLDALKDFQKSHPVKSKPLLGTYFFRLNTNHPLLTNINIRKALAIAVDRIEKLLYPTYCKAIKSQLRVLSRRLWDCKGPLTFKIMM
jgi:ABC-type oligopeptide transport system substrate-binding subunit